MAAARARHRADEAAAAAAARAGDADFDELAEKCVGMFVCVRLCLESVVVCAAVPASVRSWLVCVGQGPGWLVVGGSCVGCGAWGMVARVRVMVVVACVLGVVLGGDVAGAPLGMGAVLCLGSLFGWFSRPPCSPVPLPPAPSLTIHHQACDAGDCAGPQPSTRHPCHGEDQDREAGARQRCVLGASWPWPWVGGRAHVVPPPPPRYCTVATVPSVIPPNPSPLHIRL